LTFFKSVYNSIDGAGGGGGSVGADGGGRTSADAGGYASGGRSSEIDGSVNFAIAGATSLSKDYFVHKKVGHSFLWGKTPVTYETQIDWFNNVYAEKSRRKGERACRADMANTLFWIGGIGSSDYSRMYGSSIKSQYLNKLSVIHACKILKALINNGAKYIMVQGLPPMGCLPSQLSRCSPSDRDKSGCSAKANAVIIAHNTLLQQKLEHFRHKHPDRIISYVDTYGAYQTILANYKSYHFEEPFKACCGAHDSSSGYDFDVNRVCGSSGSSTCQDSSKYISWDGIHFTDAMNAQLADLFLNKGYCQPSFQDILKAKKCQ
jgi:phospholipase/lecithinase/hemolysin